MIGKIGGAIGGAFGFSKGGRPLYAQNGLQLIDMQNQGTDTVPAMLTPGELVVDRSLTRRLDRYIANEENKNTSVTDALLVKVISLLEKPLTVETSLDFNQRTFADILLSLSRSNARIA